jgi:membrane-associated phospholipid phosphatase
VARRSASRPRRPGRGRTAAALAALAGSYLAVRSGASDDLDRYAARLAATPRGPTTDRVVAAGTDLGSVYGLTGIALALAISGRRGLAADVAASGLLAWTGAQAAKPALNRRRPYEVDSADRLVAEPAGSSWPSGHIAVASALSTVVAPLLTRSGRLATGVATAAIGASRLYVGVHHLTDVVAGWGIGVLAADGWRALRSRRVTTPAGAATDR